MFLEIPVPAVVLREQVARLLDESATSSRYTSSQDSSNLAQRTVVPHRAASSHNASRHFGERDGAVDRNCPLCLALMEYRGRWPILSTRASVTSQGSRERLPYQSGWFCTNPACELYELKSGNGQGPFQR